MAKIEKFEDLQCWQAARQLTKLIFSLDGPITKNWAIRDQFQRASLSIMNNIAEGFDRFFKREKIRFFEIFPTSHGYLPKISRSYERLCIQITVV